jgi:hypothetical protein
MPAPLRHRLPGIRAGSFCACRGCINFAAHRITLGRRSRAPRPPRRPGKPPPRTIIFDPHLARRSIFSKCRLP